MDGEKGHPATVDEYIAQFPEDVQRILDRIRTVIREAAPDAAERISYEIPAFYWDGYLVSFGSWKRHIGLYPGGAGIETFADELAAYKRTKGGVQFPLDRPMPYELIGKIVKFRVAENLKNSSSKKKPLTQSSKSEASGKAEFRERVDAERPADARISERSET